MTTADPETKTVEQARAEVQAKISALKTDIPKLENALKTATNNIREVAKTGSPPDITAASVLVTTANDALDSAHKAIARHEGQIQAVADQAAYEVKLSEFNVSMKPVHEVLEPVQHALLVAVQKAHETFTKLGVTRVTIMCDEIETAKMLATHDILGPNRPVSPKRAKSTGGGGGSRGRFVNVTPKGNMSDREYVAAYGPEKLGEEKTAHALTATGGTLYVTARSLNKSLGHDRVPA